MAHDSCEASKNDIPRILSNQERTTDTALDSEAGGKVSLALNGRTDVCPLVLFEMY